MLLLVCGCDNVPNPCAVNMHVFLRGSSFYARYTLSFILTVGLDVLRADGPGVALLLPQPAHEVPLVLGAPDGVAQANGASGQHLHVVGGNGDAVAREVKVGGVFQQLQFGQVTEQDEVLAHKQVWVFWHDH